MSVSAWPVSDDEETALPSMCSDRSLKQIGRISWSAYIPANQAVARLPEPVAGRSNSVAAFRSLLHPGSVLEWDALEVLEAIVAEGGTPEWAGCDARQVPAWKSIGLKRLEIRETFWCRPENRSRSSCTKPLA